MGIRWIVAFVAISSLGFNINAAPKKAKYETVSEKKVQTENAKVVNASPLSRPESSRLRQERQQMEMETEEEFIQKLEQARMEDERQRRAQLFEQKMRVEANVEADPFMETMPEPQLEPEADIENEFDYRPMQTTNQVTTTVIVNDPKPEQARYYVSLGGGGLNHTANNTPDANGALAAALGVGIGRDLWIEGSFVYSFIESARLTLPDEEIDQYGFTVGPKFTFGLSNHWITPNIGGLIGYTRRQYNGGDNNSNAFDAGLSAGVDLAINQSVKIGVEGRFMTNLDYDKDQSLDATEKAIEEFRTGTGVQPLEDFDYTVFMVNAKMLF